MRERIEWGGGVDLGRVHRRGWGHLTLPHGEGVLGKGARSGRPVWQGHGGGIAAFLPRCGIAGMGVGAGIRSCLQA